MLECWTQGPVLSVIPEGGAPVREGSSPCAALCLAGEGACMGMQNAMNFPTAFTESLLRLISFFFLVGKWELLNWSLEFSQKDSVIAVHSVGKGGRGSS